MKMTTQATAQRHAARSIFTSTFTVVFIWIAPGEDPVATGCVEHPAWTYYAPLLARPVACLGWASGIGSVHRARLPDCRASAQCAITSPSAAWYAAVGATNAHTKYLKSNCPNLCQGAPRRTMPPTRRAQKSRPGRLGWVGGGVATCCKGCTGTDQAIRQAPGCSAGLAGMQLRLRAGP